LACVISTPLAWRRPGAPFLPHEVLSHRRGVMLAAYRQYQVGNVLVEYLPVD